MATVGDATVTNRHEREGAARTEWFQPHAKHAVRHISRPFAPTPTRPGSQEVDGSIPFSSTTLRAKRLLVPRMASSMSGIPLPSAPA